MPLITVTCPACGHAKQTPRESIPPRPVRATCPRCGERFSFSGHLDDLDFGWEAEPVAVPVAATAPPAGGFPQEEAPGEHDYLFTFSGSAGEYFRIWIVNLLLTIVTLGLYSAWAKVRKRRYFYGNTWLDDAPFDYTGDPLAIFKGWCLGAVLFVVYTFGSQVNPLLAGVFGLLFFLAVPWLVVRSRMFNARNSVLHNIRFTFRPNYREAYLVYAGLPLLIPFTLGLIVPYMLYRQKKFQVENSGYGQSTFSFAATGRDFYLLFIRIGLGLLLILSAVLTLAWLFGRPAAAETTEDFTAAFAAASVLLVLLVPALYFFIVVYVQTALANLTWNATGFGGGRFVSTLRVRDLAWLYFSNAAGIVLSLGLLVPWAAVRLARYRSQHLLLRAPDGLAAQAAADAEVGASGEEIGDVFGVDMGI